jgi:hypothetical protein
MVLGTTVFWAGRECRVGKTTGSLGKHTKKPNSKFGKNTDVMEKNKNYLREWGVGLGWGENNGV